MWYYLIYGGICMVPLTLCSIVGLGVIIERFRYYRSIDIDAEGFRNRIATLVSRGRLREAMLLVDSTPGPVAAIFGQALRKLQFLVALGKAPNEVEDGVIKAMEDHAIHVVADLERYLVVLASVINCAPMFGFLGTVTGMINAFNAIAEAGGLEPKLVAAGISEALITTAAGLFIALPCQMIYNYFTNRVQTHVLDIEESAAHLVEVLSAADLSRIASQVEPMEKPEQPVTAS